MAKSVDLSYKKDAHKVYYDIEVLPDVFTNMLVSWGRIILIVVSDDCYLHLRDSGAVEKAITKFVDHHSEIRPLIGDDYELTIVWNSSDGTKEDFDVLRATDHLLSSRPIWEVLDGVKNVSAKDVEFAEYFGWNSFKYDLPMLVVFRLLVAKGLITPERMKKASDALIEYDGPPSQVWDHVARHIGSSAIKGSMIRTRFNRSIWSDGHIDLAILAKSQSDSDDSEAESRFPPGLKLEMAKDGLDIVIDENVADSERTEPLSDQEFIDMILYNLNDVIGTGLKSKNKLIMEALQTRDTLRELYPYTAARSVDPEKSAKFTPPPRDATTANLASLVLIGPDRIKPKDSKTIDYMFPVPDPDNPGQTKEVDFLEYLSEKEAFVPQAFYDFFDHFRGKDVSTGFDFMRVKNSLPVVAGGGAQANIPYYRNGRPIDAYIRVSTGGAHGGVYAGLSKFTDDEIEQWRLADADVPAHCAPTIDKKNVVHIDWSSFYPVMAQKMGLYTTSEGVDRYVEVIERRFAIKAQLPHSKAQWTEKHHQLNASQDSYKLILNSATGAGNMRRKYALLPLDNKTTKMRLIGNMNIWVLGQRLAQAGAYIIATNTDGLFICNMTVEESQAVIDDYVKDYGMPVDPEITDRFINRDTSNRIEYEGDQRVAIGGRLRHGQYLRYVDAMVGRKVPYPLAVGHAALTYMDQDDWLETPYSRERLEEIIQNIFDQSDTPEAWFQVHAGSSVNRLTVNGVRQDRINRVVMTTEGDVLGGEALAELSGKDILVMIERGALWSDMVDELGYEWVSPVRGLTAADFELVSYRKKDDESLTETRHLETARTIYSKYGSDPKFKWKDHDQFVQPKLALKTGQKLFPLKVWKPRKLSNYTSTTGLLLNSRESLKNFDMSLLDLSAYTDWAEAILAGWKITADIPEIGLVKGPDIVETQKPQRLTKNDKALLAIFELYQKILNDDPRAVYEASRS